MSGINNRLGRSRAEEGDLWVFRFANGLVVHMDPFMRRDAKRVLPLGGPQDTILNRILCDPEPWAYQRELRSIAHSVFPRSAASTR